MPIKETTAAVIAASASATSAVVVPTLGEMLNGNGLTFVLWVIGGLLSAIFALLCIMAWFFKKDKEGNQREHSTIFDVLENPEHGIVPAVAGLQAQHELAMDLKGCAYDPTRLKKVIREAVKNELDSRSHHCRSQDCSSCLKDSSDV
jgi:hypothetical protein